MLHDVISRERTGDEHLVDVRLKQHVDEVEVAHGFVVDSQLTNAQHPQCQCLQLLDSQQGFTSAELDGAMSSGDVEVQCRVLRPACHTIKLMNRLSPSDDLAAKLGREPIVVHEWDAEVRVATVAVCLVEERILEHHIRQNRLLVLVPVAEAHIHVDVSRAAERRLWLVELHGSLESNQSSFGVSPTKWTVKDVLDAITTQGAIIGGCPARDVRPVAITPFKLNLEAETGKTGDVRAISHLSDTAGSDVQMVCNKRHSMASLFWCRLFAVKTPSVIVPTCSPFQYTLFSALM